MITTHISPPAAKRQKTLQPPEEAFYPSGFPLELFKPNKNMCLDCIYNSQSIDGIPSLLYMAAIAAMRHECAKRAKDRDVEFNAVGSIHMDLNGSQISCLTYLVWAAMSSDQKLCHELNITYLNYTVMISLTHRTIGDIRNHLEIVKNMIRWEIRYLEAMTEPTKHYNMQRIKHVWTYMAIKGEMIPVKIASSHVAAELPRYPNDSYNARKDGDFRFTKQRLPWLCVRAKDVLPFTRHPFSQISQTDLPDSVLQKMPKHRLMISPKPIKYSLKDGRKLAVIFGADDADGHNFEIMTYICEVLWNHRACVAHHGGMSHREIASCIPPGKGKKGSIFSGDDGRPGIWGSVSREILINLKMLMSYGIVGSNTVFRQPRIRLSINRYHLIHNIQYSKRILETLNDSMIRRAQNKAYYYEKKEAKEAAKKNILNVKSPV